MYNIRKEDLLKSYNCERRNHYVIEYIDKNKFLCIKILKGDERFAKELQDGNQSYTGADNEDQ